MFYSICKYIDFYGEIRRNTEENLYVFSLHNLPMIMIKYILITFTIIASVSCVNKNRELSTAILLQAEQVLASNPDSAMVLLDSFNPFSLSEYHLNIYHLLDIEAKEKKSFNLAAETEIFSAFEYFRKKKMYDNAALSAYYCAKVLQKQKQYAQAMEYCIIAEELVDKTGNYSIKALNLCLQGELLSEQILIDKAQLKYKEAIDLYTEIGEPQKEIVIYRSLGHSYLFKNNPDTALIYYTKGLEKAEEYNNSEEISMLLQSIGLAYQEKGDYNMSLSFFYNSKEHYASKENTARIHLSFANTFNALQIKDSAIFHINKSLEILDGDNSDLTLMASIYYYKSFIDDDADNCNAALESSRIYGNYLTSLIIRNNEQTVYETEKKYKYEQVKIEKDKLTILNLRIIMYFFIAFTAVILISIFIYAKYRNNRIALTEAEEKAFSLVEIANRYDKTQESAKNTLFDHLNILKNAALLQEHLKAPKNQINQRFIERLNEVLYGQSTINWDKLYVLMNKLHNGFLDQLHSKYPQLDNSEYQILCLIYTDFSNLEIAATLTFKVGTVNVKTSRIRRKLNIPNSGNIIEFLNNDR